MCFEIPYESLEVNHRVKSVQYRVFSGPYFPVFSPNTGKYGPEKTLYLDTFYTVNACFFPKEEYALLIQFADLHCFNNLCFFS